MMQSSGGGSRTDYLVWDHGSFASWHQIIHNPILRAALRPRISPSPNLSHPVQKGYK